MSFKRFLGLDDKQDSGIRVSMANAQLPLDLVLEMVIRQQNQLFSEMNELKGSMSATDALVIQELENTKHLHDDLIELRQALEGAAKHPVERLDEEKEHEQIVEKKVLKKKLLN